MKQDELFSAEANVPIETGLSLDDLLDVSLGALCPKCASKKPAVRLAPPQADLHWRCTQCYHQW